MSNKQRVWGASGVGASVQQKVLTNDDQKHIKNILAQTGVLTRRDCAHGSADPFFARLDEALHLCLVLLDMRETSRPQAVRENLKSATAAALKLVEALNALDGNSRLLLADEGAGIPALFDHAAAIIVDLEAARRAAEQYPKKGNLPEDHKHFLAAGVADAFEACFSVAPTVSDKGPFSQILPIVFKKALGRLARTA